MRVSRSFLLLSSLGFASAGYAQTAANVSGWLAESTAVRISPMAIHTGDLKATWKGADGLPVQVVVSAPRPAKETTVELSATPGDNGAAVTAALEKLRKAGGGTLHLAAGSYSINGDSASKAPLLKIDGLHDVTISGAGAILLLMRWGKGISISNSQRIRLADLTIRYAASAIVTGDVVKEGDGVSIAIDPKKLPKSGPFLIHQVTTLDPSGHGYAIHGTRLIFGKAGALFQPVAPGRFANDKLVGFQPGDKVAIKLTFYDGAAVLVDDKGDGQASSDITLDHLTFANSSGMGFAAEHMGRGLAIVNSHFGPTTEDEVVSIPFDGIHVSAATGDILIRDNHIAGTADDGINLSSPILDVLGPTTPAAVRLKNAGAISRGETLGLFDEQLAYLGKATVLAREATDADGGSIVHLSNNVPKSELARYARPASTTSSRYAVIGNTIADCECHGLLAQGPNGLILGNTFSGLRYNAIRLLTSGAWKEGSGAANVVVKGNIIRNTGAETKPGFFWGAISAYGEVGKLGAPTRMGRVAVNGDLLITDNTVSETQDACISVSDTEGATLERNHCEKTMLGGPSKTMTAGTFPKAPGSDAQRAKGIWIDPETTKNVRVAD